MHFQKAYIEISNICNYQCSFCPELSREKRKMSLSEFSQVLSEVNPLVDYVCLHLMGEPLAHPHFKEIIEECNHQKVKLNLTTNGSLLHRYEKDFLCAPSIHRISFSLHSFYSNRPLSELPQYLDRLLLWVEYALQKRPDLIIDFRLWNLDTPSMSMEKNNLFIQKISDFFKSPPPQKIDVRHRKRKKIIPGLYYHFDTEFEWPSLDLPYQGSQGNCYGLKSHFGVLSDGRVVPCCLDKEAVIELGNIFDTPLEKILESQRSQNIIIGFQAGERRELLCQHCSFISRFHNQKIKQEAAHV